jgi:3-carboxy-cis,cis-muconate cycloisomerase
MGGLVVNTGNMHTLWCSAKGLIVGEAVRMGLAPFIGRQPAHDVVYAACKTAIEDGRLLLDVLAENDDVTAKVSQERLAQLCDPINYLGASQHMVDNILKISEGQGRFAGALTSPEDRAN